MNDKTKRTLAGLGFALVMTLLVLLIINLGFSGLMGWFGRLSSGQAGGNKWLVLGVVLVAFLALLGYRVRQSRRRKPHQDR